MMIQTATACHPGLDPGSKVAVIWCCTPNCMMANNKSIGSNILNLLRSLDRGLRRFEPYGVLLALWALYSDLERRAEQRTISAWQLITTEASGNSGKIEALEYLNSEDGLFCGGLVRIDWLPNRGNFLPCLVQFKAPIPLIGIDLSPPDNQQHTVIQPSEDQPTTILPNILTGAYLSGIQLADAELSGANLFGAFLDNADLCGAKLSSANLSNRFFHDADLSAANLDWAGLSFAFGVRVNLRGASLKNADLKGARLELSNLSGVDLSGADLSGTSLVASNLSFASLRYADLNGTSLGGTNLNGTDLSGTDLLRVDMVPIGHLTQEQLNHVCGDQNTNLPKGLTIKRCKDKLS